MAQRIRGTESANVSHLRGARTLLIISALLIAAQPSWAADQTVKDAAGNQPLQAADAGSGGRTQELIEQLGSSDFLMRRRAEKELMRLGLDAFDALSEAQNHRDLEIATQAGYLARRINVPWVHDSDSPAVKQLLQDYAELSQDEQEQRATSLAALPDDAGAAALCRIVRYDKSPLLAKRAAALLLETKPAEAKVWQRRAEIFDRELGISRRTPSQWLRTRLLAESDSEAALTQWTAHIAAERDAVSTDPGDTDNKLATSLMRYKVALLQKLDRRDDVHAVIGEMIEIQDGDAASLTELVGWLADQKAWDQVDRVHQRFGPQFERDPMLLYVLAEVKVRAGDEAAANEIADRALALAGEDSQQHLRTGFDLQQKGLFRWAEREYQKSIDGEPPEGSFHLLASYQLAELQHDQEKELQAAEVLKDVVKAMEKDVKVRGMIMQLKLKPDHLQARCEYFYASHHAQKKDFAQQRKHLDAAIKVYPEDADVLIAMYRFPEADDAYRAKTKKLIEKAAAHFREEIAREPDKSNNYNQFAWLIGNTEGDYDEALRYSQRSLELNPDQPGYLDTLARCYYAKGDLDNAIKHQQQAVQIEPHTQVMGRQLAFFLKEKERREAQP